MNVLYKGARMIKDMYNQLNPATLTGAIDILVIEQEDGSLTASPFHVRFGKLGVLRAKEKLVNITINKNDVGLHMKLGDQGEAFFVIEHDDEEIPFGMLTSPLPSRPSSPIIEDSYPVSDAAVVKRKRRKRRKRRSLSNPPNELNSDSSDSEEDQNQLHNDTVLNRKYDAKPEIKLEGLLRDGDDEVPYKKLCNVFSDSELPSTNDVDNMESGFPYSDSEVVGREATPLGWDWGQLPGDRSEESSSTLSVPKQRLSKFNFENERDSEKEPSSKPESQDTSVKDSESVYKKNDSKSSQNSPSKTLSPNGSPSKTSKGTSQGLYLDEILDLDPNLASLYLTGKNDKGSPKNDKGAEQLINDAFAKSDAGVDSGTDCVLAEDMGEISHDCCPMAMSLCGGRLEEGKLVVEEEKFQEKMVTYEQFLCDPVGITNNPHLIISLSGQYHDWSTAGPLLLSLTVFKKPLSRETMDRVIVMQTSKKARAASGSRLSWLWGRRSHRESSGSTQSEVESTSSPKEQEAGSHLDTAKTTLVKSFSVPPSTSQSKTTEESSSCEDELSSAACKEIKRAQTLQHLIPIPKAKSMKKTTRLTSDQLKSLNLNHGTNEVEFSVTSQYQGTSRCFATIYLWKWTDKLIVSDIDGTITKSDVFGQILPVVGKDWTQGGVAQLYHNISKNGYKFIYLSARAIGQATMTKGYLNWINQQGVSLPAGPLFLSPTSLIRAFRTEVIEKKPEKFKIKCLRDIIALFPNQDCPLIAGFGNKSNDVVAYAAVGVPQNRIFTINHRGELTQEDLQMYTTSYQELADIVDTFFPALDSKQCKQFSETTDYSTFNYWRTDIPDLVDDVGIF